MEYDLLIKNGTVVDGTGAPRYKADVAIKDGKLADIGPELPGTALRTINAAGRIVAPGIIDPHTHYDAQIWWDAELTPSPWHGVTSVVVGNCGVGIAPCHPDMRQQTALDLVNVEGIPADVLEKGITWKWETYPEFMAAAGERRPSINVGFLAPLTPLRHFVMGEESPRRAATPEETVKIKALITEAVNAGALGFSSSLLPQHIGYGGKPMGCVIASTDELRAYAQALRELGKGAIEIAVCRETSIMSDDEHELLKMLVTESGRPVTWLGILYRDDKPNAYRDMMDKAADVISLGARPQTTTLPLTREVSLRTPFVFAAFNGWKRVMNRSKEEQIAIYKEPQFRADFKEEIKTKPRRMDRFIINAVTKPSLKRYENMNVVEAAKLEGEGKDPIDFFLDLGIEDDLNTEFIAATLNVSEDGMLEQMSDDNILLGLGDAGAHVGMTCDAGYATYFLGRWVREKKLVPLEKAMWRLTAQPADFFGIRDRGRLQKGLAADVMVFDEATVGSASRGVPRNDLPGGGKRYVTPATGVDYTIVNGVVVCESGRMTGERGGQLLKS